MVVLGWRRAAWVVPLFAATVAGGVLGPAAPLYQGDVRRPVADTACAYAGSHISALESFGRAVGRQFSCAMVYNTATTTWAGWASPWFTHTRIADEDWRAWATARAGRTLVITQPLVPSKPGAGWAAAGARGDDDTYATRLARNLVSAGLGRSIIRLGPEANDTTQADSLGASPTDLESWRADWARIARVMRAVPGAHFTFDWTVNAGTRAIPLDAYYPGDGVVDVIGIDSYDASIAHAPSADPRARWATLYSQPSGLGEVIAFAVAHSKPLSLPEWGLVAAGPHGGAGDDPTYVDGIAAVIASVGVSYQACFVAPSNGVVPIQTAPRSLAAYRRHFGPGGDSLQRSGGDSPPRSGPAAGDGAAELPSVRAQAPVSRPAK